MFTSKANLNGILEMNKPILVKDIFHNAKIELTEEGARAAAASGNQYNIPLKWIIHNLRT